MLAGLLEFAYRWMVDTQPVRFSEVDGRDWLIAEGSLWHLRQRLHV